MEENKTLIKSFYGFLEDTEGLTEEDILAELEEQGIDASALKIRAAEVAKRGLEKRRLSWRERAHKKQSEIEKLFEKREPLILPTSLKSRIRGMLSGNYGEGALSYAETYFRKRDTLTEKDLENLIEDLEDLNLLDESGKEG